MTLVDRGDLATKLDADNPWPGPEAFRRDVSQAQVYRVDGGHFALDTAADEIANLVDSFLTGSR